MIQNPIGIIACLVAIEFLILFFSEQKKAKKFFKFLPPMFWIYFLPMVFSTIGVIPQKTAVYQNISTFFLPAALILLLLSADIPSILKLGGPALTMMLTGSLGIMLGAPITLFIFQKWLPPEAWSGFGALSASWTGGSANMLAVKEAIHTPDSIFFPMVVVDTLVAYSWMGILIALAGTQDAFDRWNKSKIHLLHELNQKITGFISNEARHFHPVPIFLLLLIAAGGTFLSIQGAGFIPELKGITKATWIIMIASTLGILLSFSKAKKLESHGASKIGYAALYFVLTSIGARANLSAILDAPLLIAAGVVWVLIHALFLLAAARLLRAPMFLIATASQANIGGPASAPVVAAVYQPALAPVGLLLGIFGNVIGTYLGLLTSQLCHWVSLF